MKSILEHIPQILPITSPAEFELAVDSAKEEGHGVLWPSHIVWKKSMTEDNYNVAGTFSINMVPLIMMWLSKKHLQGRDIQNLGCSLNNFARLQGFKGYLTPCEKTSPMFPTMEAFGFQQLGGDSGIFFQDLNRKF